ncbi:hypothetical protein ACFE04_030760 [Oxalis oulophora]
MSSLGSTDEQKISLYIFLVGAASAALVYTLYRCVAAIGFRHVNSDPQSDVVLAMRGILLGNLIPAFKFQKGQSLVGDDFTCAVCLAEFDDGEELRTLPECNHTYHVPCIDTWFYSNTSCPVCRNEAIPLEII